MQIHNIGSRLRDSVTGFNLRNLGAIFLTHLYRRKGIKCRVILAVENADLLRQELISKYLPSLKEEDVGVCEDLETLMERHGVSKVRKNC